MKKLIFLVLFLSSCALETSSDVDGLVLDLTAVCGVGNSNGGAPSLVNSNYSLQVARSFVSCAVEGVLGQGKGANFTCGYNTAHDAAYCTPVSWPGWPTANPTVNNYYVDDMVPVPGESSPTKQVYSAKVIESTNGPTAYFSGGSGSQVCTAKLTRTEGCCGGYTHTIKYTCPQFGGDAYRVLSAESSNGYNNAVLTAVLP